MKRMLLCGAVALSLVGLMLVAYRDNSESEVVVRYDNHDNDARYYHRGPVEGAVGGASDIARGTGHAVGHTLKNIFGGRDSHRGFYDSEGNYHR